jgi:hypothetical protein
MDTATDARNRWVFHQKYYQIGNNRPLSVDRAWPLWIRQVDTAEVYTNDLRESTDPD